MNQSLQRAARLTTPMCAVALFFGLHARPTLAEEAHQVDLSQTKKYAVDHNFGILAMQKEIESARSEQGIARSQYLPRLSVNSSGELKQGELGTSSSGAAYLEGNWNLFNGFIDQKTSSVASLTASMKETELRKQIFQTELEVERLYFQYLYQQKSIEVYQLALETNRKHVDSVRKRRASGMVSDSDVMDFSLRDSLLASNIEAQKGELKGTQLALVRQIGPNLGSNIVPQGTLTHFHLLGTLADYLKDLEKKNFTLRSLINERDIAALKSSAAKGPWLPRVDLATRAGLLPESERTRAGALDMMVGVFEKWEFFSGLETTHQIAKHQSELEAIEYRIRQQIVSTMSAVESLFHRLKSIETRIDLESSNLKNAEKLYQGIWGEYNRGVKTSGDVKAAEQSLLDARIQQENFKWLFISNKLLLEMELGELVQLESYKGPH